MFFPEKELSVRDAKTLKIWEESLKHYQSIQDERFIAICYTYIGFYQFNLRNYPQSIENLLTADEEFSKLGYNTFPEMTKHLHNIALILYFFRQYEKVIQLMDIVAQLPIYDKNRYIQIQNTLGACYFKLKQFDKAEIAFTKTKELATEYKENFWVAYASHGLAKVHIEKGNYQEALRLYDSNLNFIKKYKEIYLREYSEYLLGMAKTNIQLNHLSNANQNLENINYRTSKHTKEQLFNFGLMYQDINYWLNYYDVLRKYYFASKNYKNAYNYTDSLYTIVESGQSI